MPETLTWKAETRACDFLEDVARMKSVIEARGYTASSDDLALAWESHSGSVCACWLVLPADDEALFARIMTEFERNREAHRGL